MALICPSGGACLEEHGLRLHGSASTLCCHTAGPVAPRDSVQGRSAPGEPRLAMGTVQTGSRGSAVSAVIKIPLQRAWRPTFLPQLEPGSSACCGLGTDTGNEGSTTWCPPACPHPGPCCRGSQGRSGMLWDSYQAYGTGSDVSPPSRWDENTFLGWQHWRQGSPAAAGVPEFLLSAASGSLAPCNSRGATAAGWCCWSRCCQHSPRIGADWDGCGVHPGAPCPCPGLAVPGSATQRGQGGGHLPGCAAAPLCALPHHTHHSTGHRVPRAGQGSLSLIPISPCRTCSIPRMPPSMSCSSSWPESAR